MFYYLSLQRPANMAPTMRPKKAICCAYNLLSLVHVLLPVAAEASKHGAHHETQESHLLCEQFVKSYTCFTTCRCKVQQTWRPPWDQRKPSAVWTWCRNFSKLKKNQSVETTTQELKILREYSFSFKDSHFPLIPLTFWTDGIDFTKCRCACHESMF